MSSIIRTYRLLNILSLDVVAGAIVSALFFAKVFYVTILPYGLAALGLSVWIIYTADHLGDARRIHEPASSGRHRFHQRYPAVILTLLLAAIAVNVVLLFHVRPAVFLWGSVLVIFIGGYLLLHRRFFFLKEFFVAGLYVIGVLLPSLAVTTVKITWFHAALIAQLFLVGLLNLFIFSWYDADRDKSDKLGSFATRFGRARTGSVVRVVAAIEVVTGAAVLMISGFDHAAFYPLIMTAVLLAVFFIPDRFRKHDYYRLVGDAVFLLPAVYVMWG